MLANVELQFSKPRFGPFYQIFRIAGSLPRKPDQNHVPLPEYPHNVICNRAQYQLKWVGLCAFWIGRSAWGSMNYWEPPLPSMWGHCCITLAYTYPWLYCLLLGPAVPSM